MMTENRNKTTKFLSAVKNLKMSVLKKRRDMPIDEVSEDSFYANLLLGLPKTLASFGIDDTRIRRNPPRTSYDIFHWEQMNGVRLPMDLKEFYSACDGFLFFWATIDPEQEDTKVVYGKIQINPLDSLVPIQENQKIVTDENGVKFGLDSKMFVLEPIDSNGNVVLVYRKQCLPPTICFYSRNFTLHFLANDFTTYMRMAIAHLGILQWQMNYVGVRTSETSSELFRLHLPHFSMGKTAEQDDLEEDEVVNRVDSTYMLNLKTNFLDGNKSDLSSPSVVPTKKVNKTNSNNCPNKFKTKCPQSRKKFK